MSNTLAAANVTAECLRIKKKKKMSTHREKRKLEMINLNLPMGNVQQKAISSRE